MSHYVHMDFAKRPRHVQYVRMNLPEMAPTCSMTPCTVEEDRNTCQLPRPESLVMMLHVCQPPPIQHPPPTERAIARMRRKARRSYSLGRSKDRHMHGRR